MQGPLLFSLTLYRKNFKQLLLISAVYVLPVIYVTIMALGYLISKKHVKNQVLELGDIFILPVSIAIVLPFLQAATTYLLLKFSRKESWEYTNTMLTGVYFWFRLLLVNVIRLLIVIVIVILGMSVFMSIFSLNISGSYFYAELLIWLALSFFMVRTGMFDFFIVIENKSISDSISSSLSATKNNAMLMLVIVAPVSFMAFRFLMRHVVEIYQNYLLGPIIMSLILAIAYSWIQTLLFSFYWCEKNPDCLAKMELP